MAEFRDTAPLIPFSESISNNNNDNHKRVYSQQIESQHTCGFTKYGCINLFKLKNQLQLDK